MIRRMNVVLAMTAAALALSAAPASAQWGVFGGGGDRMTSRDMPPRGMCRVWIDGVRRENQPRATDCRTAERQRRYYEDRYGRNARVIYGNNSNGRYENGRVYGTNGSNCRTVERVVLGRVIRQNVCDNNDRVYDRNGRVYDRDGRIYDRNGRVYDRNGREIYRDRRGVWRDKRGRVYDRRGRRGDRDSDSDSDSD